MVNELNSIKCIKNMELGDISTPCKLENQDKNYIVINEDEYKNLLAKLSQLTKENEEMKLEHAIAEHLPLDLEDVKIVVKEKIKNENLSMKEAIKKVKKEYPNLFHIVELDGIFNELIELTMV